MNLEAIFFYILGFISILSALMVILQNNPIKSILWLLVLFISISGLYFLLKAPFIAIVNIIVYAGAIMVLFLFVLMLINFNSTQDKSLKFRFNSVVVVFSISIVTTLITLIKQSFSTHTKTVLSGNEVQFGHTENLGKLLFSEYGLPFELTSILFLTAILGAILLSKKEKA